MHEGNRLAVTPEPEELNELLAGFTDKSLDPAQLKRLQQLVESSEEVRAQLVQSAVLDRLLRSMADAPVPTRRIMDAVAAEARAQSDGLSHAAPPAEPDRVVIPAAAARAAPRAPAPAAREHSALWAAAILLLIGTAIGVALYYRPAGNAAARRPEPAGEEQPLKGTPEKRGDEAPQPPPDLPSPETNRLEAVRVLPTGAQPAAIPQSVFEAFPLDPPPPPADEDLSPPRSDGSDEPGFVPPPSAWLIDRPPRTPAASEEAGPEASLLWIRMRPCPGARSDATPLDLRLLADEVRRQTGMKVRVQDRADTSFALDAGSSPFLYLTGSHHFQFTPAQRRELRRFLLSGGMALFNPALGSKPFYDSARRELRLTFPDAPIERLAGDHPVFHAYHDVTSITSGAGMRKAGHTGDAAWCEGITISCRTVALISRWGLDAGWSGRETEPYGAYASADAVRLGVNIFCYAAAARAWARQPSLEAVFSAPAPSRASSLCIGQIVYDGPWQTRYAALPILLHTFNRRTDVPVNLSIRAMRLSDTNLFDTPLLYLTGHAAVGLCTNDAGRLGQYLKNGGFLFAEACCGRSSFDRSFRALMERVLPGQPLAPIPPDAPLFIQPNRVEALVPTPSLGARLKDSPIPPRLEGIQVGAGYGVVYSPYGLAGAWEMFQMPFADGYNDPGALKLGQNILLYAITQ